MNKEDLIEHIMMLKLALKQANDSNCDLFDRGCNLQQENKQLRDKLDKIKEYVENNDLYTLGNSNLVVTSIAEREHILEIIGDNNDNTND